MMTFDEWLTLMVNEGAWDSLNKRRSVAAKKRQADQAKKKEMQEAAGGKFTLDELRNAPRRVDVGPAGPIIVWTMRGKDWVYLGDYFDLFHPVGIMRAPTPRLGTGVGVNPAANKYAQEFVDNEDYFVATYNGWNGVGTPPT
jgi:hypothetical protein